MQCQDDPEYAMTMVVLMVIMIVMMVLVVMMIPVMIVMMAGHVTNHSHQLQRGLGSQQNAFNIGNNQPPLRMMLSLFLWQ